MRIPPALDTDPGAGLSSFPFYGIRWADIAAAFALTLIGFFWFSSHADFPVEYHPDEPSKVEQLRSGEFNFRHPILLLQTAKVFLGDRNLQEMAPREIGVVARRATALFAGGLIGLGYLVGVLLGGRTAGIAAGTLLLLNGHLYELSHYLKEDPAVAFGFVLFALALLLFGRKASFWTVAGLGVATGIAVSAKAVGVVLLPVALAAIWWQAPGTSFKRLFANTGILLVALAGVFIAINFPMLEAMATVRASVGVEVDKAVLGHGGVTRSVPHGVYFAVFREGTNVGVWILLTSYYFFLFLRRKEVARAEWILALLPLALWALLSFFPKTHHRYFLPGIVLLSILAAGGLLPLLRLWGLRPISKRAAAGIAILLATLVLVFQVPKLVKLHHAFASDSRAALLEFLTTLPDEVRLLQDSRGQMTPEELVAIGASVLGEIWKDPWSDPGESKENGPTYFLAMSGDYGRYFRGAEKTREEFREEHLRRRTYYEWVFSAGEKVWERPAGAVIYTQPKMELFRLPTLDSTRTDPIRSDGNP